MFHWFGMEPPECLGGRDPVGALPAVLVLTALAGHLLMLPELRTVVSG